MTTSSTTDPSSSTEPKPESSLLNQADEPKPVEGAPATYTDFKVPDGTTIDKATLDAAMPMFKEMNLSQDQAQKLVDFYSDKITKLAAAPHDAYREMRQGWVAEVKADPEIGSKLPEVKATIGRALNLLGAGEVPFREAMDLTGVGDNPAFVKGFYKFAQLLNEGTHVAPNKPAPVVPPNQPRPTMAQAIFPELPSSAAPQRG